MVMWGKGCGCVFLQEADDPSWIPKSLVKHPQVTQEMAAAPPPEAEDRDEDEFEGRAEPRVSLPVYTEGSAPDLETD